MAHKSYNDLRPYFKVHPIGGEFPHEVIVVGVDQVHLVCMSCGIDVTVDAVDAGLPVVHEKVAK